MCYSALVQKDLKRLEREFGARIDTETFLELYALREKNLALKIPDGLDQYFLEQSGSAARSIRKSIQSFNKIESERSRQEIEDLEAEIKELESRLKVKVTKTHQKSLDVKTRKRERLLKKAERAVQTRNSESYRIYPFYFAPVLLTLKDQRWIVPMRYRILPSTGVEVPTAYNVFNARRDSLTQARTWKNLFGKKHAIFPFLKFFEWVESDEGGKVELKFSPDGYPYMWSASLYEEFHDKKSRSLIRSFAMVTDAPPPEVAAAGHDRCPVFLDRELIDKWERPQLFSTKDLDELLNHKQPAHYSHALAA